MRMDLWRPREVKVHHKQPMGALSKHMKPARKKPPLRRGESDVSASFHRRRSLDDGVRTRGPLSSFNKLRSSHGSRRGSLHSSTLSQRSSLSSLADADGSEGTASSDVDPATQARAVQAAEEKRTTFHASLPTSLLAAHENRDVVAPFHPREVLLGPKLGSGEFSHVFEVTALELQDEGEESTADARQEKRRLHMKKYERYRETRKARYAVKHIKEDYHQRHSAEAYIQATSDLALEAEFLASLQHPNIIKLRGISSHGPAGFGEGPRGYFLVLDRLTETLDERLRKWRAASLRNSQKGSFARSLSMSLKGSFTRSLSMSQKAPQAAERELRALDERFNIALQIAAALQYLHSHSIIFRDLKPCNVGFDVRGDVKIFDFGLARVVPDGGCPETDVFKMSGAGSPRYMAPECLDHKPYNLKSEVYSFGIIAWEILSGKTPYAFVRRKHQLVDYVVRQHGRPVIDESWPAPIQGMLESSFDADTYKRPKMALWYNIIRETLVSLRGGDRKGLGDSFIGRRRSYDSMKDLLKDLDLSLHRYKADVKDMESRKDMESSMDRSIHKYSLGLRLSGHSRRSASGSGHDRRSSGSG